uniref:Uncharacterized protein n=1 Tax=Arundo donax TaxID=35708 RepID=A0A0A9F5Q9_ARUDO
MLNLENVAVHISIIMVVILVSKFAGSSCLHHVYMHVLFKS